MVEIIIERNAMALHGHTKKEREALKSKPETKKPRPRKNSSKKK